MRRILSAAILSLLFVLPLAAQQRKSVDNRAQVAILGTYHFANQKLDYAKFEVADVLSPQKQREIAAVTKMLTRFRPTKVAVEWPLADSEKTNADYGKYLAGQFELTRNEVHQIGFRLAKEIGLKRVYLIDQAGSPQDTSLNAAVGYAMEKSPAVFESFNRQINDFTTLFEKMQTERSVPEILRYMNSPTASHANHRLYIQLAEVGAGDNFIGAEAVSGWYRRNLKIYANLAAISEPGDRILVLYGQGHKPILEQIAIDSERIRIVDVLKYLQ
jgi:hypothetical protein